MLKLNASPAFNKSKIGLIINLSSIKANNSKLDALLYPKNVVSKTPAGSAYLKPPSGYNQTFFENEIKKIKNESSKTQNENFSNNSIAGSSTPCGVPQSIYSNVVNTNSKSQSSLPPNNSIESNVISTEVFNCPMIKSRTNVYNSNIFSSNWAGYVTTVNPIANPSSAITAINGSWIVQTALPSNNTVYSSQWIGIGGFSDLTLIQTGTSSDYGSSQLGTPSYYAWYELLPAGESELSPTTYPVAPNDIIRADIKLVNSSSNLWNITISDLNTSRRWTFSTLVNYNSSKASAEVIDERPEISSFFFYYLSNLSDFGISRFGALYTKQNYTSYVTEGGKNMPFGDFSPSAITMLTNSEDQAYASPLALKNNTSFKVMYGPYVTPAPAYVDTGTSSIKFLVTAGGGPYNYDWSDNGMQIGTDSNTLTFNFNSTTNSITQNLINVSILNSTTNSLIAKSMPDPILFRPSLAKPTLTSSANVIDSNQFFLLNSSVSGGTSPYLYNFSIYNTTNSLVINHSFFSGDNISVLTSISKPGSYYANVIVTDSASPPSKTVSLNTPLIKVNPAFEINSKSSTPNYIDLGEDNFITLHANLSGGTGPFSLYMITYLNYSNQIASNSINNFTTQIGNTISITIPINSIGTYYTISEGIDSGTSTPFINTQSNTTIVSTALTKPNLTIGNPILDQGQVLNLFYSEYNGTFPYTYNVLIYNNTSNQPETFVSDNLFSHTFNLSTRMPQNGIYYAKVIVNDSASPPESKTSSDSSNIIVNKRPEIKQ